MAATPRPGSAHPSGTGMLSAFPLLRRQERSGALAQLVERLHGMQEVRGSNPLSSTRSEACGPPMMVIGEQNGEQAASYS